MFYCIIIIGPIFKDIVNYRFSLGEGRLYIIYHLFKRKCCPILSRGCSKIMHYFRFTLTVTLRLRVPHMTVVSAQLVSLNYAYGLSVGWGVLS